MRAIEYLEVFAHQKSGLVVEMEKALNKQEGDGESGMTGHSTG